MGILMAILMRILIILSILLQEYGTDCVGLVSRRTSFIVTLNCYCQKNWSTFKDFCIWIPLEDFFSWISLGRSSDGSITEKHVSYIKGLTNIRFCVENILFPNTVL